MKLKQTTLCLLLDGQSILLAMKKRGFGVGKWNGYGGKIENDESIVDAAIREMKEEIEVTVNPTDLNLVGQLKFFFPSKPEWNQEVNIFLITAWQGTPAETEEMKPEWFVIDKIPYSQMWPDDQYWLPLVLSGKKIRGEFYFTEDGQGFMNFKIIDTADGSVIDSRINSPSQ